MSDDPPPSSPGFGPCPITSSPYIPYCGKIGHPSRRIASIAANRVTSAILHSSKGRKPKFNVFRCEKCDLWHLGNHDWMATRRGKVLRGVRRKNYDLDYGADE